MAASRTLLPRVRVKFLGCVAVSQLNSSRLSQLFGASFQKSASYVTFSNNHASVSDPRPRNVKTSLVVSKFSVRNFSSQNWLGGYAILLLLKKITLTRGTNNTYTRFRAYLRKRRIICQFSSPSLHAPFTSSSAIGQKNSSIWLLMHIFMYVRRRTPSAKFTKIMLSHSGVFFSGMFFG